MQILALVKNGKSINNHFVLFQGDTIIFQSYETLVASYDKVTGRLLLADTIKDGQMCDYSNTTRKHFAHWLNTWCNTHYAYESKKQFEQLIKDNVKIELTDYSFI